MIARLSIAAVTLGAGALALAPPRARPAGPLDPAGCTTSGCHDDLADRAVLHGPVAANDCTVCHDVVDEREHTFQLPAPVLDLCTFCHDMRLEGVVHEPLVTGDCTGCHDPHGGPNRLLLKTPTVDDLCQSCHADVAGGRTSVHGPVAAGACSACHAPHAAPHPGLLPVEGRALCLGCHAEIQHQVDSLRVVHGPVNTECLSCHDPHATDHPMMLVEAPRTLCLDCHDAIRRKVEQAAAPHAVVTEGRACLYCHEAHGSNLRGVLRADAATLCFDCHDKEIELADGRRLGNIKAVVDAGRSLHGPVAHNDCGACHDVHGGDHFRLLVQAYPPGFYAPFEEDRYALCFGCHDSQLLRDERTTALTNFRNGDVNLHYLHVNRAKGRTCRACHETHAAESDDFIRESVPFGPAGWQLPIRFEPLADGGRCAPGCHVPYEYNRVAPVQYAPPGTLRARAGAALPAPPGDSGESP